MGPASKTCDYAVSAQSEESTISTNENISADINNDSTGTLESDRARALNAQSGTLDTNAERAESNTKDTESNITDNTKANDPNGLNNGTGSPPAVNTELPLVEPAHRVADSSRDLDDHTNNQNKHDQPKHAEVNLAHAEPADELPLAEATADKSLLAEATTDDPIAVPSHLELEAGRGPDDGPNMGGARTKQHRGVPVRR